MAGENPSQLLYFLDDCPGKAKRLLSIGGPQAHLLAHCRCFLDGPERLTSTIVPSWCQESIQWWVPENWQADSLRVQREGLITE
ncbi:hypothetical protein DSO57_1014248 [Entomophthora muscae]|uniref:Uncharacterized protein n=1 Tax=Entomophthora muscae TaxID=34485 RepID=A0ACC2UED5_9FUNG|nr:hypothetical protein DSO57_1014248 [Entomophthora muscae]